MTVSGKCSIKGVHWLLSGFQALVAPQDLAMVVRGLKSPPFEPLQGAYLKIVSLKTGFNFSLFKPRLTASCASASSVYSKFGHLVGFLQGRGLLEDLCCSKLVFAAHLCLVL